MQAQTSPPILRRLELSAAAWQLFAEQSASLAGITSTSSVPGTSDTSSPQQDHDAAGSAAKAEPLSPELEEKAWAQLRELELADSSNALDQQWVGAVAMLMTAPISIDIRATFNDVGTVSTIGLLEGRGIAVHQRQLLEASPSGTKLVFNDDAVEITLFNEENLWRATRRLLPPLDNVRAASAPAKLNAPKWTIAGDGIQTSDLPTEFQGLLGGEDANVTMTVTTLAQDYPPRVWGGMWAVKNQQLFSIRTTREPSVVAVEVPAGNIAHELIFAVVGSHDALASLAQGNGEAASKEGGQS